MVKFGMAVFLLTSCGADISGTRFRQEKHERIENQKNLYSAQQKLKIIQKLASNIRHTAENQWTVYSDSVGDPLNSNDDAKSLCNDIGFVLPTEELLLADGVKISEVEALGKTFDSETKYNFKTHVYIRDDSSSSSKFLICTRKHLAL